MPDYVTHDTFFTTAEYCLSKGVYPDAHFMAILSALDAKKTFEFFQNAIRRLVKSLYKGNVDEVEFVQVFEDLISGQLTRAWFEGMADNGLTKEDMIEEWQASLDAIISEEFLRVYEFAQDIKAASRLTGESIDPLLVRADLWANRYNDVVNQARLETADSKDRFEWVYGEAEHCETCAALNGIVAFGWEWEQSGFHPQQPPNPLLDCGGWRCQCSLEPTDRRRSPKALDTLMNLAVAGKSVKGGEGSGNFGHAGRPGLVGGSGAGGGNIESVVSKFESGEGEFIGRGAGSIVTRVGDYVVKVATPGNENIYSTYVDRWKRAVSEFDFIPPTEFVIADDPNGGKRWLQIMQYIEPGDNNITWDDVHKIEALASERGWSLGGDLEPNKNVVRGADGKVWLIDLGFVRPPGSKY